MPTISTVRIRQVDNYKFLVDFGEGHPDLTVDEAPPIGSGDGPFPEQVLAASVSNCLCASLVFALGKYKQDAKGIEAVSSCRVERNDEGRFRVRSIDVEITMGAEELELPRVEQVLEQFERFCTVSESVKAGIPVTVAVRDGRGVYLK